MKKLIAIGLLLGIAALAWAVDHYRSKAESWRDTAYRYQRLAGKQAAAINDMTERQQQLAELDKTHTQNLVDAKNQIAALQHDIANGRKQLQLSAHCPTTVKPSGADGLGNATTPELTADARRDYWRLRSGIEKVTAQVKYLQQYITEQCLR